MDDQRDRITALEMAARLTSTHENAPSVEVARFLVQGLEDDDPQLRVVAISLLCRGQDVGTAAEALVDATGGLARYVERLRSAPRPRRSRTDADLARQAAHARDRLYADLLPAALAGGLARLDTPGTRAALLAWSGPWDVAVAGSVLELATPEALRATVRGMAGLERECAALRALVQGLDSGSAPRPPRDWDGDAGAWAVDRRRALDACERRLVQLGEQLDGAARRAGLEPPAADEHALLERWSRWLDARDGADTGR
jgi:hypothetical protein